MDAVKKCSIPHCVRTHDTRFKLCPHCREYYRQYYANRRRLKEETNVIQVKQAEVNQVVAELEGLPQTTEFLEACERYRQACERDLLLEREKVNGRLTRLDDRERGQDRADEPDAEAGG